MHAAKIINFQFCKITLTIASLINRQPDMVFGTIKMFQIFCKTDNTTLTNTS